MRVAIALLLSTVLLAGCASLGGFSGNNYQKKYGLYVEHSKVQTFCLLPKLRLLLWKAEMHFKRAPVVTSGYRNPFHNWKVGGAWGSYHQKCMAADIFIPGVPKSQLIKFLRNSSEVGGLGCYPGRKFVHVDIRRRPNGYKHPVQFKGC
jgi:zinc D-Ala-D-Ala carboxypeptidase